MKVLKFGGTSVGSPERMREVARLVTADGEKKIVVLSAMSGTTNSLVEIADCYRKGNPEAALFGVARLRRKYADHVEALYARPDVKAAMRGTVENTFARLDSFAQKSSFEETDEKEILAQGELTSTRMVSALLEESGVKVTLLYAPDFVRTNASGEPDQTFLRLRLGEQLLAHPDTEVFITQGFICSTSERRLSNLGRGGSDYTASLIGAAIGAYEIQIWTDIDGMHNNDPREVEGTSPVRQLNFSEAAELAYFGAKILHPTCIQPARFARIPVRLLNTMDPSAPGTLINNELQTGGVKAVAAKDNITAIRIVSSRMLLATGFLRKVFEIFETYRTSIDMITTSEVGVSLSVDNKTHLEAILEELRKYGTVTVDEDMCIVCVVGDLKWQNTGFETLAADALASVPVRMISYGGSNHNISFLVRMSDKKAALKALQQKLFASPAPPHTPQPRNK